jgi:hypothetical protein
MKKSWTIALLIALAVAGALLVGCSPSEADEGQKIENPDIVLKMLSEPAQHKENVTNVLFEQGKTYEVTLSVTSLDEALAGGFFAGVLQYEPGGGASAVRVSGWSHSASGAVINGAKDYKWSFEATGSTPSGLQSAQYFELMAQNSGYTNYGASDVFGIKGSITVAEKGAINPDDYDKVEIQTNAGSGTVVSIESAEYQKVLAANKAGNFLRLYVVTKTNDTIGKIGPDKGTGTFLNLTSNSLGLIDVDLQELFAINTPDYNYININIWSPTNPQDGLTKVELWTKK